MVHERLMAAKELIQAGRYEAARDLLYTISGDATAQRWIAEINRRLEEQYYALQLTYLTAPQVINTIPVNPSQRTGCSISIPAVILSMLACVALVVLITPTPSSTKPMTDAEALDHIADYVSTMAGGRNLDQIVYMNGDVTVSYLSAAVTDADLVEEWVDIFEAIAGSVNGRFELRTANLMMGSPLGDAVAMISVEGNTLQNYHERRITRSQLVNALDVIEF